MQKFDLHMHTTYCDGMNTAEEMIVAAAEKGLETVGISGHSYTPHDTSYCMSRRGTEEYIEEVRSLSAAYKDRIRVLLGIEMDCYADTDPAPYDYIIGSVHYIFTEEGRRILAQKCDKGTVLLSHEKNVAAADGINSNDSTGNDSNSNSITSSCLRELERFSNWTAVDDYAEDLPKFADVQGMDIMSVAELYFDTVGGIVTATDCDIIGHFDLLTKFSESESTGQIFDSRDPRYVRAWKNAIDRIFEECRERYQKGYRNRLEKAGLIVAGDKPVFEINTGAMSKGYRTTPYPAEDQREYIRSKGGILIMNSDSHKTETICYGFENDY